MSGKWAKVGLWFLMGALGIAAVGGTGSAVWMYGRLRAYEMAQGVATNQSAEPPRIEPAREEPSHVEIPKAKEPQSAKPAKEESKSKEDGECRIHEVKPGDDIVSIAIMYGVSPSVIMDLNGLTAGSGVISGQRIRLPPPARGNGSLAVEGGTPRLPVKERSSSSQNERLEIRQVEYAGDDRMVVHFSKQPDMTVLREYLSVAPVNGAVSLEYNGSRGTPRVIVKGDFLYRTNLTLRVRAGCPAVKGDSTLALGCDFVQTLRRKDAPPRVRLMDSGRYLPPGGARMLAIDSINVAKVHCAAAAIPAENIVQFLARENGEYVKGPYFSPSSGDSEDTEDLADTLVEWDVETCGRVNEHATSAFRLRTLPDAASNGVFLVAIRSGDLERRDYRYWSDSRGEMWNPNHYRIVCVTDVGLTVRQKGRNLIVWTTSLMTGNPIPTCTISIYGSNRRLLGEGQTDATGLCEVLCTDRADPFVVVARTADGKDTSFVCLAGRQSLDERWLPEGSREEFLAPDDVSAFVWTERDIYRHDEKMMLHVLLRNGRNRAPKPFPVELRLKDTHGRILQSQTIVSDALGAVAAETFTVPAERPSGRWTFEAAIPGTNGKVLGTHTVNVEEFAPPQIRVAVKSCGDLATNFSFRVSAEHLYGSPARGLRSEGAVVFTDVAFAPKNWEGWRFGNDALGLLPSFRRIPKQTLDEKGTAVFPAPLFADRGRPKAAVKVTSEGTVFEEGGRPARARASQVLHYYPFYVGTTLGGNVRIPEVGFAKVKVACVRPDGTRLPEIRKLKVAFERVENVYGCREDAQGWSTWTCDRIRVPMKVPVTTLETQAGGDVELEIPFRVDGDYAVTLTDEAAGTSFGSTFWLGSRGDDEVRAPLANPSEVTLTPDKMVYRPGDVPRILVKAPFAGWSLLTIMREGIVSTRVLKMNGATQEITLNPVETFWAPNVDISLSVVQSADNGGRHQTVRAHGRTTLAVRPWENEIPVQVKSSYKVGSLGGTLTADVTAISGAATGCVAVVTVVDEGIHLLTDWTTPDPVGEFAKPRSGNFSLHDLFENLLPVWDGDPMKVRGVKTGGGAGAEMLGRVSPVPTRRFRPLAQWQTTVPLTNGVGRAIFELPEFSGEVRVTALAYSAAAVGVGDVLQKVAPRLVLQPDAPRFAAPGDAFDLTVTLVNRSGASGEVKWQIQGEGPCTVEDANLHTETLAVNASLTRMVRVHASEVPGEVVFTFTTEGLGERHVQTLHLPVRPAVAAREVSGTIMLNPGESRSFEISAEGAVPAAAVRQFTPNGSALASLVGALEYLADYPHGCLEQTSSRIFPLVTAGGFLNRLAVEGRLTNRTAYVEAGVRRVTSMIRAQDFVMWPDCAYAPWDREVSLYAAHFLIAAEQSGVKLNPVARNKVMEFLKGWSVSTNLAVSAYACHTLALAGAPASDRMLLLYDRRERLSSLDCARLARAFARSGDRMRAERLMITCAEMPATVKEGAFAILALLELDPSDSRLAPLVRYLETTRQPRRYSWGTTEENAHALLALAAYYRHHPPTEGTPSLVLVGGDGRETALVEKRCETVRGGEKVSVVNRGTGTAWLTWRTIELPRAEAVTNEARVIRMTRTFLTPEGLPAPMDNVARGDLLIAQLTLESDGARSFNDLVVQDLLPAAFEPVLGGMDSSLYDWIGARDHAWVMRSDARDDRMLVFSRKFHLPARAKVVFRYPVRVVSSGDFVLPGPTVEAMYAPSIRSTVAPTRIVVTK